MELLCDREMLGRWEHKHEIRGPEMNFSHDAKS